MTSQNDEAEEIMRQVEKEEEAITSNNNSGGGNMSGGSGSGGDGNSKQCLHLCIINLVIGTLYCSKGNFEFGISRIIKVS